MLECPNPNNKFALTESEFRVHFTLWALSKSPLIIGCTLGTLSSTTMETLTNSEIISFNQDPLGVQSHKTFSDTVTGKQIWAGPLQSGSTFVALVNTNSLLTQNITATPVQMGLSSQVTSFSVRDVWSHTNLGTFSNRFTSVSLAPHSVQALLVTPIL